MLASTSSLYLPSAAKQTNSNVYTRAYTATSQRKKKKVIIDDSIGRLGLGKVHSQSWVQLHARPIRFSARMLCRGKETAASVSWR
mmetsp:Transcript_6127/g.9373  ORF Transcript_6127/g.9373 Transcript_6127/m.9373 type:complete len:85 (+) Transcript_6127:299-553(+)